MARIRFSGGIVPAEDRRVWLVEDPRHEVDESRPNPGAAVVVGPAGATARQVDRARREARRLIVAGGALVAAANVDIGDGFETARLEGGGESRREAVLAAVELLGVDQLDRIGPRQAVLVALFGARATKRVGAAALAALAATDGDLAACESEQGRRSAVRLAVAASDLLVPEQLEEILQLKAPAGIEPVPRGTTALLPDHLATVLGPFSAKRRAALVRSVWDDVVEWQQSDAARARARRRRVSAAQKEAARATVRRHDDAWWRARFDDGRGGDHSAARMLAWVPHDYIWHLALRRAFQECVAATVLVRAALAAEDRTVEEAVLANLGPLAYAATAHVSGLEDRVESLHQSTPSGQPAADRAWALASAVVLASDPRDLGSPDFRLHLRAQLRRACELGMAVLQSTVDMLNGRDGIPDPSGDPGVREWRALVGYSARRNPYDWWAGEVEERVLARRLEGHDGDPAEVERIEDLLWLAELADALAAWFGRPRADVGFGHHLYADIDPPAPPPDPRLPSLESVPLAVAGAAQLLSLGAATVPRPTSWSALVAGLVAGSERLGLDGRLTVPADVADWDGRELPGHELRFEVGRTAQQLAEWGNYMGNCIATYADDAGRRFALLALRDGTGTIRANVSVVRRGERWSIDQALARFNGPLADELDDALRTWAHELRVPATPVRPPQPAGPTRSRHRPARRGAARGRVREAAAKLGDTVDDLALDRADAARVAIVPIARELGWAADEAGDYDGPFVAVARPRRSGPLAEATGRVLESGMSLAELWPATGGRPLAVAVEFAFVGEQAADLRRLTDLTVPPSLRVALSEPRVWRARVVELACRRVRRALVDLLLAGDPRLDAAVAAAVEPGFLATAVLVLTASGPPPAVAVEAVSVGPDGAVPGRPPTSVRDQSGVWSAARSDAVELGAPAERVEEIERLLVPAAWMAGRGWPGLWARAHREARRRAAPIGAS